MADSSALFYQPPPPFVGGRQPLEPRKLPPSIEAVPVNTPPFSHRGRTPQYQSLAAWAAQPDPYQFGQLGASQPFAPRRLNPSIIAVPVNPPPISYPERTPQLNAEKINFLPDPTLFYFHGGRQPFEPAKLNPSITAVPVNPPPTSHPERTAQLNAERVNFLPDPTLFFFDGGRQPFEPAKLNPSITGTISNPPPFTHPGRLPQRVIDLWFIPDIWSWTFMGWGQPLDSRNISPAIEAVPVNEPPYTYGGRTAAEKAIILAQWVYDPSWTFFGSPQPFDGRNLPPAIVAASTPPPYSHRGRSPEQNAAISVWFIPDVWSWTYLGWGQPLDNRAVSPAIEASSVAPPYTSPGRLLGGLVPSWIAWVPPDPLPTLSAKLAPSILTVPVNDPPYSHRGRTAEFQVGAAIASQPYVPNPYVQDSGLVAPQQVQPFTGVAPTVPKSPPPIMFSYPDGPIIVSPKLAPALLAVRVDAPIPRYPLSPGLWVLPEPTYQTTRTMIPQQQVIVSPPAQRPIEMSSFSPAPLSTQARALLAAFGSSPFTAPRLPNPFPWPWGIPEPLVVVQRPLSPAFEAVRVDPPIPRGYRLDTSLWWYPLPIQIQRLRPLPLIQPFSSSILAKVTIGVVPVYGVSLSATPVDGVSLSALPLFTIKVSP